MRTSRDFIGKGARPLPIAPPSDPVDSDSVLFGPLYIDDVLMVEHALVDSSQASAMHTLPPQPHRQDDEQLADEYVQNFELDHLEDHQPYVKREPFRTGWYEPMEPPSAYTRSCRQWADPPGAYPQPLLPVVDPSTPPETPPTQIGRSPGVDDLMWMPRGGEPLDMRLAEWERRDWRDHDQQMSMRPSSEGSAMSPHDVSLSNYAPLSGGDDLISDDLLMTLSVRELNKRLHGFPREDVTRLKQKRRTLKNRGYAQNCRYKRMQHRQELELTNRSLMSELHVLKLKVARVTHERDMLKQRLSPGTREGSGAPASSEFYPEL